MVRGASASTEVDALVWSATVDEHPETNAVTPKGALAIVIPFAGAVWPATAR
jgi:hypothetical protein